MTIRRWRSARAGAGLLLALAPAAARSAQAPDLWTTEFAVEPGELGPTGRNPWFVLEPGWRLVLAGGDEQLTITVLAETRTIDGVETRVVEERETKGGVPVEVSRNFYAISRRTNAVFYFGEEVDVYRHGAVAAHEGAWHAGANGARFGLMMPGLPLLGARYYQEQAPRVAMDRARIVSLTDRLTTPAGSYTGVLRVEETTPLEGGREYKRYARGVGLVEDGSLRLVRAGPDAAR